MSRSRIHRQQPSLRVSTNKILPVLLLPPETDRNTTRARATIRVKSSWRVWTKSRVFSLWTNIGTTRAATTIASRVCVCERLPGGTTPTWPYCSTRCTISFSWWIWGLQDLHRLFLCVCACQIQVVRSVIVTGKFANEFVS
jgi:hypothetical protein